MIPLRDENPSRTTPWVVYSIIAVNIMVFLKEISLPQYLLKQFVYSCGVVPVYVTTALKSGQGIVPYVIKPLFTSMFLHGGWLHIIGNMWYLWIFGDNVEDRLGHVGFLVFYLFSGLLAGAVHVFFNPQSPVPTIGASGAIAAVLGAYMICFPMARVICFLPVFLFFGFTVVLPAMVVLFFWFIIQFFSGALSLAVQTVGGGVAYWAHTGGFVAGMVLVNVFPRSKRSRQNVYPYRHWGRARHY